MRPQGASPQKRGKILSMSFLLQGFLDCPNVPVMEAYDILQILRGPLTEAGDGGTMRNVCSNLHLGPQLLFGSGLMLQTLSCLCRKNRVSDSPKYNDQRNEISLKGNLIALTKC